MEKINIEAVSGPLRNSLRITMAKSAFVLGDFDKASKNASDAINNNPDNDGQTVHDGNIVLGRVALKKEQINQAKEFLIQAGKTSGSPALGSFGPNMALADELLKRGEKELVLNYFDLCRVFWKRGKEKLDVWCADVKKDKKPDFGANLLY